MNSKITIVLFILLSLVGFFCNAQNPSDFLPEKSGKWSFTYNKPGNSSAELEFRKNLTSLTEWFHQNVPMLNKPVGYDLWAVVFGTWDDHYKKNVVNYGMRGEIVYAFQLFLSDLSHGGKWVVEPPQYKFYVNNTESGHHSMRNFPYFDDLNDDPKLEKQINEAAVKLNGVIAVFPFQKQLALGVNVYKESEDGSEYHIVVFNPDRPLFWIPITLKELTDMYLEYFSLHQKNEIDRMLLDEIKKEIAEIPEEELAAPAFLGHDSRFALSANGLNQGLQLMRFNPDYWDRSLSPSAIQFMTFPYPQTGTAELDEYYKNNGHPFYSQLLVDQINWNEVAGLIMKGK